MTDIPTNLEECFAALNDMLKRLPPHPWQVDQKQLGSVVGRVQVG
jgi:hypothetical protein